MKFPEPETEHYTQADHDSLMLAYCKATPWVSWCYDKAAQLFRNTFEVEE